MSNRGSITLAELLGKLDLLEIKCHRCDRHGRVNLARLIDEHGADTGLPDLPEILAGDSPRVRAALFDDRCASYCLEPASARALPGSEKVHHVGGVRHRAVSGNAAWRPVNYRNVSRMSPNSHA